MTFDDESTRAQLALRALLLCEDFLRCSMRNACRVLLHVIIYNKGDLHGGKTTMLYLNLSGH